MSTKKWDSRFVMMARMASTWSKDPGTKVGAVAVSPDRRVLSVAFNGFPRGMEDSDERYEDREYKLEHVIHAELNVVLNAARSGVSLAGSTVYVFGLPVCSGCAKSLVQAGVTRVVACGPDVGVREEWDESWVRSTKLFDETGVAWERLTEDDYGFWTVDTSPEPV